MLAYIIGVVLFALGIGLAVALHEAGHMLTAKAFGMKVRRYFIGFGPKVFSFRRGETEYGLKIIPAGGFCDIAGMTALDEVTPDEAPRAMWRYPVWKRFVVLVSDTVLFGYVHLRAHHRDYGWTADAACEAVVDLVAFGYLAAGQHRRVVAEDCL